MKAINKHIRSLHRDIGYFIIGLTVIYSLSGILLVFVDTDFLKSEEMVERQVAANLSEIKIAKTLRIPGFEILKEEGDIIHFKEGTYNQKTGHAVYLHKELPFVLTELNKLHKSVYGSSVYVCAIIYGVLLLFMALSAFWMFPRGSKHFTRGIWLSAAGVIAAIILLIL